MIIICTLCVLFLKWCYHNTSENLCPDLLPYFFCFVKLYQICSYLFVYFYATRADFQRKTIRNVRRRAHDKKRFLLSNRKQESFYLESTFRTWILPHHMQEGHRQRRTACHHTPVLQPDRFPAAPFHCRQMPCRRCLTPADTAFSWVLPPGNPVWQRV